jgi:hypothetical protein
MVVFAAIGFGAVSGVRANGAFPDEFSVHFPVSSPHRIFIGANFGLLVSEDDGLTWRNSCEPWVVAGSNAALAFANVSFYNVTADGVLLADAGDIRNMTRSSDVACTWPSSTGSITGQLVADFFPDPNDAAFVLANIVTSTGSYVVASHDGGKTFDAPRLYETPEILTGVEIARSKPGVAYATSFSSGSGTFVASADRFATPGTATTLPLDPATEPRILAVDPDDEKKVYLRIVGAVSDSIKVTLDGGRIFQTILDSTEAPLSSFLRASDGTLYAGTRSGKLYIRKPGATAFTVQNAPHLRCLGQRPGTTRIYGCTDLVVDGYSLGASDDNGATFQRVMSFRELLGPLTCTPVQTNCQAHWERIQGVLGIGTRDAGQGGSTPSGGSHCASAGTFAWSLVLLAAFVSRRRRATTSAAPGPSFRRSRAQRSSCRQAVSATPGTRGRRA